jgi:hypothetical protein
LSVYLPAGGSSGSGEFYAALVVDTPS